MQLSLRIWFVLERCHEFEFGLILGLVSGDAVHSWRTTIPASGLYSSEVMTQILKTTLEISTGGDFAPLLPTGTLETLSGDIFG